MLPKLHGEEGVAVLPAAPSYSGSEHYLVIVLQLWYSAELVGVPAPIKEV
jgi:hypothetical protein